MLYPLYNYYYESNLTLSEIIENFINIYTRKHGRDKVNKIIHKVKDSTKIAALDSFSIQKRVLLNYVDFGSAVNATMWFMIQSNTTQALAVLIAAQLWHERVNSIYQFGSYRELRDNALMILKKYDLYEDMSEREYDQMTKPQPIDDFEENWGKDYYEEDDNSSKYDGEIHIFNTHSNLKGSNSSSNSLNNDKQKSSHNANESKFPDIFREHQYYEMRNFSKGKYDEFKYPVDYIHDYFDLAIFSSVFKKFGIEALLGINARTISIPQSIEPFDGSLLNKFEIVIVPSMNDLKFKKLLLNYNGIVLESNFDGNTWIGAEMTISAFCSSHGNLQPKSVDSIPFFLAKDGKRVYFSQELLDSFSLAKKKGERFKLDLTTLKIREYFSMKDKKFYFGAYYN